MNNIHLISNINSFFKEFFQKSETLVEWFNIGLRFLIGSNHLIVGIYFDRDIRSNNRN